MIARRMLRRMAFSVFGTALVVLSSGCESGEGRVGAMKENTRDPNSPDAGVGECAAGDTKSAGDACNTCSCDLERHWTCTARACPEPEPEPEPEPDGGLTECPAPQIRPDVVCPGVGVWVRDPATSKCCSYSSGCVAPADWTYFASEAECKQLPGCPEPQPESPGLGGTAVWARNPYSKECCHYDSQYAAPLNWPLSPTEAECKQVAECPAPQPEEPGTACLTVTVWARDPLTRACCVYGTSCQAPSGWPQFYGQQECEADTPITCDTRYVHCVAPEPECPLGQVPWVRGMCYGGCAQIEACDCTGPEQCPDPDHYTCHLSAGHCGPYVQ
jgi:hypothetical protein